MQTHLIAMSRTRVEPKLSNKLQIRNKQKEKKAGEVATIFFFPHLAMIFRLHTSYLRSWDFAVSRNSLHARNDEEEVDLTWSVLFVIPQCTKNIHTCFMSYTGLHFLYWQQSLEKFGKLLKIASMNICHDSKWILPEQSSQCASIKPAELTSTFVPFLAILTCTSLQ